jgi:hypothetical protein
VHGVATRQAVALLPLPHVLLVREHNLKKYKTQQKYQLSSPADCGFWCNLILCRAFGVFACANLVRITGKIDVLCPAFIHSAAGQE